MADGIPIGFLQGNAKDIMPKVNEKSQCPSHRARTLRWRLALVWICFALWGMMGSVHQAKARPESATPLDTQGLARILEEPCLRKAQIGLRVLSLRTGQVLFDHRGDELLIPASNVKLITTAAALSQLGAHYTFQTAVHANGRGRLPPRAGGVPSKLKGDLFLEGRGDPELVSERLWLMARDLKIRGLAVVEGNLVADDSYFDDQRWGEGWPQNSGPQPFYARIGALSLNFNTVTVHVEPALEAGQPAHVVVEPPTHYIRLVNRTRTRRAASRDGQAGLVIDRVEGPEGNRIVASGTLPLGAERITLYRSISDPSAYTAWTFKEFLSREGIKVKGKVVKGKVPPTASLLATYASKPLFEIVQDLNKLSNNFIAEQILKTMGAELKGRPGTAAKGLGVVEAFLAELGIPPQSYRLMDGSGLSRLNRLSPTQIVRVLEQMYRSFPLQAEYLSSLAVMGEDGSLRQRLAGTSAQGRIRAKTGTLDGVRCLSGYVQPRQGEPMAFSFLVNFGQECPAEEVLRLQSKVCLFLASDD